MAKLYNSMEEWSCANLACMNPWVQSPTHTHAHTPYGNTMKNKQLAFLFKETALQITAANSREPV